VQKYKGLVKSSQEINHYYLTPVMGTNSQLFFSKFADQDVIIMVSIVCAIYDDDLVCKMWNLSNQGFEMQMKIFSFREIETVLKN
jgi:hypothetical protein